MRRAIRGVVVDFAELSDAGRDPSKQINEDAAGFAETAIGILLVVCDGMGGHSAGREASTTGIRTILEIVGGAEATESPRDVLHSAIENAGRAVYAVGGDAPQELRPGSTCVAALLHPGGAEIAHVGDSRAYLLRGESIARLTRDHSMVQQMVDAGVLSESDAATHPDANKITRALGMAPTVDVEVRPEPLALSAGDRILLCTDGLTDLVQDAEIQTIVARHSRSDPALACSELVALANERGGHDNITVQLVHIATVPTAGTVVLPDGRTSSTTLLDEPPAAPGATVPGSDGPSPTLLDEPPGPRTERTTLPGDAPVEPRPQFQREPQVDTGVHQPRTAARLLVVFAAVVAAVIVGGVGVWWVHGALRGRGSEEEVPPPPPPPPPTASERQLRPLDTGEPVDAAVDAPKTTEKLDAAPDAAPDAASSDGAPFP